MVRTSLLLIIVVALIAGGFVVYGKFSSKPPLETKFVIPEKTAQINVRKPENFMVLPQGKHVYQTFNNCGPATLSMILAWYGIDKSQEELGIAMRPYQHPKGDNDDKTIFVEEFAIWTKKHGLSAKHRVNGSIDTLKLFVTNGIPVVVKTWLKVDEDIGHFRIVRGFDERQNVIIQDDSYHGPNRKISYFDFLSMWQPFNYGYILVYPPDKEALVSAILSEEADEKVAYEWALKRAEKEVTLSPDNIYPRFNIATSAYHLGDFERTVTVFEEIEARLPRRMLWYQLEPILAYQKLNNYSRVFEITERIFTNGNRAFSELYQIRGEIYLIKDNKEAARREFERALFYNKNFEPAREALDKYLSKN